MIHDRAGSTTIIDAPRMAGRFRIVRPFKEGGLGQVSIAEDMELHREVAFKEIKPKYERDSQNRARFLLEGEITGKLEHFLTRLATAPAAIQR